MNPSPPHIGAPLSLRLLRRILLVCALSMLLFAGARAGWEYRAVLNSSAQLMAGIEQAMAPTLANSLWEFDAEHLESQLQGIRSTSAISYAAVLEHDRVVVESGARQSADALTSTSELVRRQDGQVLRVGQLLLQVDMAKARGQALDVALVSLAFSAGLVLLVSLAVFLLTRGMVSRHLSAAARHFQALDLAQPGMRLPKLRLDKKWAGDELDVLCLAVNDMQENLAQTYAKAWVAECEARSQARFPEENPNPVMRVTAEGALVSANPASADFLAQVGGALGQRLPAQYTEPLRSAFATGQVQRFETECQGRTYAFVARPLVGEGCVNLYGLDISRRVQAEAEVRRNMARLQCLVRVLQHSCDSVQEFLDFCLAEVLKLTESRYGYIYHYSEERREFVLNTWSRGAMQACAVRNASQRYDLDETGVWGEVIRQRKPIVLNDFQAPHPQKCGYPEGHVPLSRFMSVPVFGGGQIVAVAGVANKDGEYTEADVMQFSLLMDACWQVVGRMTAEQDVRRSLHEKEILLKEIHHRVKNNMQIISSLLFLQMEYVSTPEDRELFAESQKRIQAMALVHEELYKAVDLSSVGMREYVSRLVGRVLAGADIPVCAQFELDEVRLPVTHSIPCGLALNELVMNAVKHAFRPGPGKTGGGHLRVALHQQEGAVILEVEDNGPGLPPDFDVMATPTLGMTLVASLVRQLGGELTADGGDMGGARFRLVFPLPQAAALA
ncbi:GAF domain-containing protein [Humidesulfovibrio idahonensis]